jgi:hypothetical protein
VVTRPPIFTEDMKLSDEVKFIIKDRQENVVGVIFSDEEKMIIEFFDQISPMIVFDKKTKEFSVETEVFVKDPKPIIQKLFYEKVEK